MGNCLSPSSPSKSSVKATVRPKKVLVLGASGFVGKATLANLASRHGKKLQIYAGVRDPEKFGNNSMSSSDIHIIQADMGAPKSSLAATLKDFDCVFLVTPGHEDRTKLTMNAIQAAKEAGVQYTLVVSVLTADESKTIFGSQFAPIERALKTTGLKSYGILRLPLFMDNFYAGAPSIKENSTMYDPRNTHQPFTPIALNDVGKAAADILANPSAHHNQTYRLTMPSFTLHQLAGVLSQELGKAVSVTTVSYPAAKEAFLGMGFPEWQVDGILELFRLIDKGSSVTNQTRNNSRVFEKITRGEKPMTMIEWVKANAGGFQ